MEKGYRKVLLDPDTVKRIDKLRAEMEKEYGYPYSTTDLIENALTALEDVRGGA